jgi:hypothetical protein
VLLTIDGGPRFSGLSCRPRNESLQRKPCVAFENHKGETAGKKHTAEELVGKLRAAKVRTLQGSDCGAKICRKLRVSESSSAGGAITEA